MNTEKLPTTTPTNAFELRPSADLGFTQDRVSAQGEVIALLQEAVRDSGAEFALSGPHDVINPEERYDTDKNGVTREIAAPDFDVENWVRSRQRYSSDGWTIPSEGSEIILENRNGIVRKIVELYGHTAYEALSTFMQDVVSRGLGFSNDVGYLLIGCDPHFFYANTTSFPEFSFDAEYVRTLIDSHNTLFLMESWPLIDTDVLQSAVDSLLEVDPYLVFDKIEMLPQRISLSHENLKIMANIRPELLVQLIGDGRFPEAKYDLGLMAILRSKVSFSNLVGAGLYDTLSIIDLDRLGFRPLEARMVFNRLFTYAKRMRAVEEVSKFVELFGVDSVLSNIGLQSCDVQSYIFQQTATDPNNSNDNWMYRASQFNKLYRDDYLFILDHLLDLIEWSEKIESIGNLFDGADQDLKMRFDSVYSPIKDQRMQYVANTLEANQSREDQRGAEETYFKAESVRLEVRAHDQVLSDQEIVEALEIDGCVKYVGTIDELASDASRTNKMTCVDGSISELKSYSLGDDSCYIDGTRVTITEHAALQNFLRYVASMPAGELAISLGTELTYIGEREYAEAVKGIAKYWKWFLGKDESNQLYVGTVVAEDYDDIKSDRYMFDRILAHFSDEELMKYRGRILTGGDAVTQKDPSKVKVALIDDWTISGSQLRFGYMTFISKNPDLANSIEIQLIASSSERVAIGLEGIHGPTKMEQMMDMHLPVNVRSYFVAHDAPSARNSRRVRISGTHSSVDFGFAADVETEKHSSDIMPLITAVVRPYRQKSYTAQHIERLEKANGVV